MLGAASNCQAHEVLHALALVSAQQQQQGVLRCLSKDMLALVDAVRTSLRVAITPDGPTVSRALKMLRAILSRSQQLRDLDLTVDPEAREDEEAYGAGPEGEEELPPSGTEVLHLSAWLGLRVDLASRLVSLKVSCTYELPWPSGMQALRNVTLQGERVGGAQGTWEPLPLGLENLEVKSFGDIVWPPGMRLSSLQSVRIDARWGRIVVPDADGFQPQPALALRVLALNARYGADWLRGISHAPALRRLVVKTSDVRLDELPLVAPDVCLGVRVTSDLPGYLAKLRRGVEAFELDADRLLPGQDRLLAVGLAEMAGLRRLRLFNVFPPGDRPGDLASTATIAAAIASLPALEHIEVHGLAVDGSHGSDGVVAMLSAGMVSGARLRTLHLSHVFMGPAGVRALRAALERRPASACPLERLNLYMACPEKCDEFVEELVALLASPSMHGLTALDIGENHLGLAGLARVAPLLVGMRARLRGLGIGGSGFTEEERVDPGRMQEDATCNVACLLIEALPALEALCTGDSWAPPMVTLQRLPRLRVMSCPAHYPADAVPHGVRRVDLTEICCFWKDCYRDVL